MQRLYALPDLPDADLETPPIERASTIPSSWYTDPRFYAFDSEAVFSTTWQSVGRVGQVANAGDYFLATLADNPIIVVRGKDLKLRAFYNVCRHRGGPLATEDGNAKMLKCRYHGWTYQLDGSLRGVPRFDRVELFDRKDYGLVPVGVDVWEELVFVRLSNDGAPLGESFIGITDRIAPIRLTDKRFYRRVDYQLNCNWKVYVDNYLEGYHVPIVHPELCKMYEYKAYSTETYGSYSLQHAPLGDDNIYSSSDGEAFYCFVFPNLMLNVLPGRLQINRVAPLSHDRTSVVFEYFYDDLSSTSAIEMIEKDIEASDRVQQEDIEICEHVQKGLTSKAYDRGRFSPDQEEGVYHFQKLLREAYRRMLGDITRRG